MKNINSIELLADVPLEISVELGRTMLPVRQILGLQQGAVVQLENLAGDCANLYVNGTLFARGEVIVVADKFGVRLSELIAPPTESE